MSKRKNEISKAKRPRKRLHRITRMPLNLPENIWKQYKQSLIEKTNSNSIQTNSPLRNAKKYLNEDENALAEKKNQINKSFTAPIKPIASNYSIVNSRFKEKNNKIFKQLAVKVDNSYDVTYNCLLMNDKLKESIDNQNLIYDNIVSVKEILTNCSVRTLIPSKKDNDSFSDHIISADAQLENVFKLMQNQNLLLLNLQSRVQAISIPVTLASYSSFDNDLNKISSSLTNKQSEFNILKTKYSQQQERLQNITRKLKRIKFLYQKCIQEKNNYNLQLKKKLCIMKKRLQLFTAKSNKKHLMNCNHRKPTKIRIQQVQQLMTLANSLMENIYHENSNQSYSLGNDRTKKNKDKIISELRDEINELKKLIQLKDNQIQELIKTEKQRSKQLLILKYKKMTEDKEKNHEITRLTSALDNLKRKSDRWLLDKFHQKCHLIMLFEKMKQIENKKSLLNIRESGNKIQTSKSEQNRTL